MDTSKLHIPGVNERDVDLLMLEEFISTKSFGYWFLSQLFGDDCSLGECVSAVRSVTQSNGESDLEVEYLAEDGIKTLVLIENKVGAGLQPLQAERYMERGDDYISRQRCNAFYTVIVAPDRYFASAGQTKGFHFRVGYEALRSWFERAESLGARRSYKVALLSSAIEKATLGYQPVADAPVTHFWQEYWRLCSTLAPELEMNAPDAKPARSGFISMRPPALKSLGADIVHKVNKGRVDLQLRGLGEHVNTVRAALGTFLETDMTIERAEKSAVVRVLLPKMSTVNDFSSQEPTARSGIHTAQRMLRWSLKHRDVIVELRRVVLPTSVDNNGDNNGVRFTSRV